MDDPPPNQARKHPMKHCCPESCPEGGERKICLFVYTSDGSDGAAARLRLHDDNRTGSPIRQR